MLTVSSDIGVAKNALERQIREDNFGEGCPGPAYASTLQVLTATSSDNQDVVKLIPISPAHNDVASGQDKAPLKFAISSPVPDSLLQRNSSLTAQRPSYTIGTREKSLTRKKVERLVTVSSILVSRLHRHWLRPCLERAKSGMDGSQWIHAYSAQRRARSCSYSSSEVAESIYN